MVNSNKVEKNSRSSRKIPILFEQNMVDSGISSDEDDVPTSKTSSKRVGKTFSPFYKLKKVLAAKQAQLTGNKNDNGRGKDDSDTEQGVQTQPNTEGEKTSFRKRKSRNAAEVRQRSRKEFHPSSHRFPK